MEKFLSELIVDVDCSAITCGNIPNSIDGVSYCLIRLISIWRHNCMLEFVTRIHSPAHDTAISTHSNQLLFNLTVDVFGLPTEAVNRIRKLLILNMMKDLAIESTDDFDCSISETYCTQTSICTDSRATDFILSQFHSESIGKVTEYLFSRVCFVIRSHHIVQTFVFDNFLFLKSFFIEIIIPFLLGLIFQ
jgi:hypothetical protein